MSIMYDPLRYINIAEVYLMAPYLWDALIFLCIFLGLTTYVFKNKYGKQQGKTVAIGVGLALTISLLVWEYQTGWYIGRMELAILPLTVIYALVLFLLYKLFTDLLEFTRGCALSLAFLITYPGIGAMFNYPYTNWYATYPLFGFFVTLMLLLSVIMLVICVMPIFGSLPKGKTPPPAPTDKAPLKETKSADDKSSATKKQPETSQQLLGLVSAFLALTSTYIKQAHQFKAKGDALLDANNAMAKHRLSPDAVAKAADEFLREGAVLSDTLNQLQETAKAIANHADVATLHGEALEHYAKAQDAFLATSIQVDKYFMQLQHHLANNLAHGGSS
jgi:hypothetical protein